MQISKLARHAAAMAALCAAALLAVPNIGDAESQTNLIQDGRAGFVVHAFGSAGARGETECPAGRSLGFRQIFEQTPEGQRQESETDEQYTARLFTGEAAAGIVDGQNICANPNLAEDPHYRIMTSSNVVSYGIDLDGEDSRNSGAAPAGACAHNDFTGVNGARGVDNQMLRVSGCDGAGLAYRDTDTTGDLPNGEGQSEYMLQGAWGILISLRGVDDLRNDDDVQVGIYSNADPIQIGPDGHALPGVSYSPDEDQHYRAETRGRIVNGVLTTEATDIRLRATVAGFHVERPLNHARVQFTISASGELAGYIAGYMPVEAAYDLSYGFRTLTNDDGELAPTQVRDRLSVGGNTVMGRTCHGAYHAMYEVADGDPDPQTGRCTSISTQYWVRATPAFVLDP